MVYNVTSMLDLLAKIRRDSKMRIEDIDAVEWAKEALDAIEVDKLMVEGEDVLTVVDYKAQVPLLMSSIDAVFHTNDDADLDDDDKTWVRLNYGEQSSRYETFTLDAYLSAKTEELESTNFTVTRFASRAINDSYTKEYYYTEPGWIKTSFETGEIKVLSKKYPTDDKGMLMIPDHYQVKEAIKWFVVMKAVEGGQKHPTLNYGQIERKWYNHAARAANSVLFPSIDKMRNQFNNDQL